MKFSLFACILLSWLTLGFAADTPSNKDRNANWMRNYKKWQSMSPERKQELKQKFDRLKTMSQEDRTRFSERARMFERLSPERKEQLRKKLEIYRGLPSEQQDSIKKFAKRWSRITPERRQALMRRIQKMRSLPPEKRERLLERKKFWRKLSEEQKKGLRHFLFSEKLDLESFSLEEESPSSQDQQ